MTHNENLHFTDYECKTRLPDCSKLAKNWRNDNDVTMTSQFANMLSSSKSSEIFLFLLLRLVTGPSFMSILPLVLELRQFSFIRD